MSDAADGPEDARRFQHQLGADRLASSIFSSLPILAGINFRPVNELPPDVNGDSAFSVSREALTNNKNALKTVWSWKSSAAHDFGKTTLTVEHFHCQGVKLCTLARCSQNRMPISEPVRQRSKKSLTTGKNCEACGNGLTHVTCDAKQTRYKDKAGEQPVHVVFSGVHQHVMPPRAILKGAALLAFERAVLANRNLSARDVHDLLVEEAHNNAFKTAIRLNPILADITRLVYLRNKILRQENAGILPQHVDIPAESAGVSPEVSDTAPAEAEMAQEVVHLSQDEAESTSNDSDASEGGVMGFFAQLRQLQQRHKDVIFSQLNFLLGSTLITFQSKTMYDSLRAHLTRQGPKTSYVTNFVQDVFDYGDLLVTGFYDTERACWQPVMMSWCKDLNAKVYSLHFQQLFKVIEEIQPLCSIACFARLADLNDAQREGFYDALQLHMHERSGRCGLDLHSFAYWQARAQAHARGFAWHYMKSVDNFAMRQQYWALRQSYAFGNIARSLLTCDSTNQFAATVSRLMKYYPEAHNWLICWHDLLYAEMLSHDVDVDEAGCPNNPPDAYASLANDAVDSFQATILKTIGEHTSCRLDLIDGIEACLQYADIVTRAKRGTGCRSFVSQAQYSYTSDPASHRNGHLKRRRADADDD